MSEPPYTVPEVAKILRVSEYTVRAMTRDGRLGKIEGLGRIRIPRSAVRRLLDEDYDGAHGKPEGHASAETSAPWKRHRGTAEGPLPGEAVGGGGALHRPGGPAPRDVVVRRVTRRGGGPAPR